MWSVFPAPLLISYRLTEATDYMLETYGNEEVIAVNQDPAGKAGKRLVGDDFTSNQNVENSNFNVWGRLLHDDSWALVFVNNANSN